MTTTPTPADEKVPGLLEAGEMSFTKWHRIAREYALETYGLRRVSVDSWKVMYASGETPQGAVKYLADQKFSYGQSHAY